MADITIKSKHKSGDTVVKPMKKALNLFTKVKGGGEQEITILTVIDQDDQVIKVFNKQDYGPRFWFKAHQYANNYTTPDQQLRIKELE